MAKVQHFPDLSNLEPEEFVRHGSQVIGNIHDQINGNLEFDKNFKSQTVAVVFAAANTDTAIQHNLNKSDVHYLTGKKSVACDIFSGTRANTNSTLYLRSSQPATVTLVLY